MPRSRYSFALWAVFAAVALLLAARPVQARDDEQGPPPADPPIRVARLSFLDGPVSFQPAGETDWVAAVRNRPLTTGDSLWLDAGGRAELHVGSTAIRLGQNTAITLLEVSDHVLQLRLAQGSMIVNARHVDEDDVLEADSPNLAFSMLAPGEYRIDVNPDGTATSTAVWRGQGQVNGGGRAYTVVAGQQASFEGLDSLNYEIAPVPEPDSFQNWATDRDRQEERSDSANYVSREVTGYQDLDAYGQWSVMAAYGPVWTPVGMPYGWAPYRYGHWVWVEPWGWTWVDDQPWGFAPFHYGRWAYVGASWVWIPGPVVVRPVYAPALVVFVGAGPGVGWFPLGPGEVFVPAYRVSRVYVTNINITNTRVETERINYVYNNYNAPLPGGQAQIRYVNRGAPGGVTVVTRDTFVSARPVGANVVAVNAVELNRAPVTRVAAVAPARASVMGTGARATATPPAAIQNRRVISNRMPAPEPAPFAQRQEQLRAHPGQPSVRAAAAAPRPAGPATAQPAPGSPRVASQPAEGTPPREAPAAPSATRPATVPPSRTFESVGPPPGQEPAPATGQTPAPAQREAQSPPPQSRSNVQLAPPPRPKSPQEMREEDQKNQRYQQQQQQQRSAPPSKNKPQEKEKEKPGGKP